MAADATKLVIPGHGTVFWAEPLTVPPADPLGATGFKLDADGPSPWKNLGHTSKQNTIAFTKEGGEKETLDTFLADGVRTTTASTQWGVNVAALQFDHDNLDLAFNGDWNTDRSSYIVASPAPVNVALFLYFQDTTGSLGFWLPNTEISLGDAPSVDAANFFELPLSASILSVPSAVSPAVNGRAAIFEIFKSGLAAPTP